VTEGSTYRVFGVNLATEHPMVVRPRAVSAPPDVVFRVVEQAPDDADWAAAELRYATPVAAERTEPDFHFLRLPDRDVIRITGAADFHVADDTITCHLLDPQHGYLVDIALFGLVLAFWLERRGVATYHAAAVALSDDAGVGFLASSGTGKSSIAAGLLAAGARMITEDLLSLTWRNSTALAEPGLPQLRLWPESAARFSTSWERLAQPHPDFDKRLLPVGPDGIGAMSDDAVPLRRLYVLERGADDRGSPTLERVPARAAVVELLRHSYLPHEAARFGWQARRLEQVSQLLETVPLRRLRFPSGAGHLPAVRSLLLADLPT
jgi:hypothetical protein